MDPAQYLAVVEGFGANGEAAQLHRLLEARGDVQLLQLLVGVAGQLEGAQLAALLGQRVQGVAGVSPSRRDMTVFHNKSDVSKIVDKVRRRFACNSAEAPL